MEGDEAGEVAACGLLGVLVWVLVWIGLGRCARGEAGR